MRKALIADDDALIRAMLGSELRSLGFTVIEAQNGDEALELYAKEHPDVLFLDLLMPKLNGLDALKKLRADGAATVPAVLVTALTRDTVRQFEVDGVKPDAYLEKPFRLKAVAKIVKQIFGDGAEVDQAGS
ncbi:MAG TPA: response regulator [Myxococcales bacterium]|nr:response regulator [Myxococcales bacterium]